MAVCCRGEQRHTGETQSCDGLCFTHTSTLLLRGQANKGFERRQEIKAHKHKNHVCVKEIVSPFFLFFVPLSSRYERRCSRCRPNGLVRRSKSIFYSRGEATICDALIPGLHNTRTCLLHLCNSGKTGNGWADCWIFPNCLNSSFWNKLMSTTATRNRCRICALDAPFKHDLFLRIKAFLTVCVINKGNPLSFSLIHIFQVFSKSRYLV